MDAATLYTIVTMLDGRERIIHHEYASVAQCEAARAKMVEMLPSVNGLPTRYSCERHINFSPNLIPATARTKD